jgi:hypothetical protein
MVVLFEWIGVHLNSQLALSPRRQPNTVIVCACGAAVDTACAARLQQAAALSLLLLRPTAGLQVAHTAWHHP